MGTETNGLKSELLYSDVPASRHPPQPIRERLRFGLAERRTAALTAVPEAQP